MARGARQAGMSTVPARAQRMLFEACEYDPVRGEAVLRYRLDRQPLVESLRFVDAPVIGGARLVALRHVLGYLHLAAGVSYYKALLPQQLALAGEPPSARCAAFMRRFYRDGLAEFAWRNDVDLGDGPEFPAGTDTAATRPPRLRRLTAAACGGGIGSAVTLEALKQAGEPLTAITVNCHPATERVASMAGVPLLRIERRLDPVLSTLNRRGAWNGHVPITGILSFAIVAAALIYDFDAIAMSNERSADEGNFSAGADARTLRINHQWSKSQAFETPLRELLMAELCPGLEYASVLRPFGELQVMRLFAMAQEMQRYHSATLSCNRAFRAHSKSRHWCGDCDKCRFVFLGLAAFMGTERLLDIFGADLLGQPEQRAGFRQLIGLGEHKPFDCVGTVAECRTALALAQQRPERSGHALLTTLAAELAAASSDALPTALPGGVDQRALAALPARWRRAIATLMKRCSQGTGSPDTATRR